MAMVTIGDDNYLDHCNPVVDGTLRSHGLVPRDFDRNPHGSYAAAPPFSIPLIPESEWQSRLDAQNAAAASMLDIRNTGNNGSPIPSRDQDGIGYCWCHSGVSAMLVARAVNGEPYADLSAFAVGSMIKGYRDEGGNGIEGVQFVQERGVPTAQFWPQQSRSRANDNPQTWENAKLHRWTKWADLDPSNMKAALVTCLLLNIPVVSDFNWWSHSVLSIKLVSLNPFTTIIWNSWGDSWSQNGCGQLTGSKAIPDNGVACITGTQSQG